MTEKTENTNRYLFVITGFDAEPDHTAAPLVLANSAISTGADAIKPKSFPALGELLESFREAGGRIGICPPCGGSGKRSG